MGKTQNCWMLNLDLKDEFYSMRYICLLHGFKWFSNHFVYVCANCKVHFVHSMLNIGTTQLLHELQHVRLECRNNRIIWNLADGLQHFLLLGSATSNYQTITLNRILLCQTKILLYVVTGLLIILLKKGEHTRYFSDLKHILYATVKSWLPFT